MARRDVKKPTDEKKAPAGEVVKSAGRADGEPTPKNVEAVRAELDKKAAEEAAAATARAEAESAKIRAAAAAAQEPITKDEEVVLTQTPEQIEAARREESIRLWTEYFQGAERGARKAIAENDLADAVTAMEDYEREIELAKGFPELASLLEENSARVAKIRSELGMAEGESYSDWMKKRVEQNAQDRKKSETEDSDLERELAEWNKKVAVAYQRANTFLDEVQRNGAVYDPSDISAYERTVAALDSERYRLVAKIPKGDPRVVSTRNAVEDLFAVKDKVSKRNRYNIAKLFATAALDGVKLFIIDKVPEIEDVQKVQKEIAPLMNDDAFGSPDERAALTVKLDKALKKLELEAAVQNRNDGRAVPPENGEGFIQNFDTKAAEMETLLQNVEETISWGVSVEYVKFVKLKKLQDELAKILDRVPPSARAQEYDARNDQWNTFLERCKAATNANPEPSTSGENAEWSANREHTEEDKARIVERLEALREKLAWAERHGGKDKDRDRADYDEAVFEAMRVKAIHSFLDERLAFEKEKLEQNETQFGRGAARSIDKAMQGAFNIWAGLGEINLTKIPGIAEQLKTDNATWGEAVKNFGSQAGKQVSKLALRALSARTMIIASIGGAAVGSGLIDSGTMGFATMTLASGMAGLGTFIRMREGSRRAELHFQAEELDPQEIEQADQSQLQTLAPRLKAYIELHGLQLDGQHKNLQHAAVVQAYRAVLRRHDALLQTELQSVVSSKDIFHDHAVESNARDAIQNLQKNIHAADDKLRELQKEMKSKDVRAVKFGVGVFTGSMVLGTTVRGLVQAFMPEWLHSSAETSPQEGSVPAEPVPEEAAGSAGAEGIPDAPLEEDLGGSDGAGAPPPGDTDAAPGHEPAEGGALDAPAGGEPVEAAPATQGSPAAPAGTPGEDTPDPASPAKAGEPAPAAPPAETPAADGSYTPALAEMTEFATGKGEGISDSFLRQLNEHAEQYGYRGEELDGDKEVWAKKVLYKLMPKVTIEVDGNPVKIWDVAEKQQLWVKEGGRFAFPLTHHPDGTWTAEMVDLKAADGPVLLDADTEVDSVLEQSKIRPRVRVPAVAQGVGEQGMRPASSEELTAINDAAREFAANVQAESGVVPGQPLASAEGALAGQAGNADIVRAQQIVQEGARGNGAKAELQRILEANNWTSPKQYYEAVRDNYMQFDPEQVTALPDAAREIQSIEATKLVRVDIPGRSTSAGIQFNDSLTTVKAFVHPELATENVLVGDVLRQNWAEGLSNAEVNAVEELAQKVYLLEQSSLRLQQLGMADTRYYSAVEKTMGRTVETLMKKHGSVLLEDIRP